LKKKLISPGVSCSAAEWPIAERIAVNLLSCVVGHNASFFKLMKLFVTNFQLLSITSGAALVCCWALECSKSLETESKNIY